MSVLETPRLLFRGQMSWDPITTNNDPAYYDEGACEPLPAHEAAKAYRASAITAVATDGNWNPHGTHRSAFFETEISGVDIGAGAVTDDPVVGAPVSFVGMLVDCEPYGSFSSQLFFDTMSFGIAGGCRIACARHGRAVARYINSFRNAYNWMIAGGASIIWQTSFPKSGLQLDAQDSPALQALAAAMEADQDVLGLTVRWNAYRTIYFDDPRLTNTSPLTVDRSNELIAKLNKGGWQPNPARSQIVGVLGLWRDGEPAQEPGDRALLSVPPGEIVGTAYARVHGSRLTIDLGNSVAEVDELLNKQNLGTLHAVLAAADGSVAHELGTLEYHQYDRAAYDRSSGIVTIDIGEQAADQAKSLDIQVRAGDGTIYLAEQALRALPVVPNNYVDEGGNADAPVAVYDRGGRTGAGVEVTLYDGNSLALVASAATDASGTAHFSIPSIAGGAVEPYILVAGPNPVAPQQLDPLLTPYFFVRTLPADADIAAMEPSFANVYAHVLLNWHALAPCMDNWLDLGDESQVRAYAPVLRVLTDPANFESFRFMPVTRDMTSGERTLLTRFLDSPAPPPAAAAELAEPAPAPAKPAMRDLAALSRFMRSPR